MGFLDERSSEQILLQHAGKLGKDILPKVGVQSGGIQNLSHSIIIRLPRFHMWRFRNRLSSMIPDEEGKMKQEIENSVLIRQNPVKKKWRAIRLQSNIKNLWYVNKLKRTGEEGRQWIVCELNF